MSCAGGRRFESCLRYCRSEQVEPELTVDEIFLALGYAAAPPITCPAYVDKLLDQRNATTN